VIALGAWPFGHAVWLLIAGSACVYHGALALNDWADREQDRRLRPERPIPSGAVPAGAALALASALIAAGVGLALAADRPAGAVLGAVALCAVLYDVAGRGPWRGPLLLGACRAGNLAAGMVLARGLAAQAGHPAATPAGYLVPVAALYGLYVLVVSRVGRLEDVEDEASIGTRPRAPLLVAAALLCAPGALALASGFAPERAGLSLALGAAGAFALVREASRGGAWPRGRVLRAMGLALRRLLVFTAALAVCAPWPDGLVVAAAILCGYPLAHVLRGVFPPS
jgi:4-hydroxybenzoate polyprenyltransferase